MIPSTAAICVSPGKPLEIADIMVEPPRDGEVLVEITHSGLCHTDLTALDGQNASAVYPLIAGHEGAGRVVECGPGVTSLKAGDHVIPLYGPECGACGMCQSGRTNLCWSIKPTRDRGVMPDGTARFRRGGEPVHHFMGTSTFSRFTVVPEIALCRIRQDAPLDVICLFGCGVTTGVGAALGAVRAGDRVAVFGLGGVGINVIQGARIAGACQIIGIDIADGKASLGHKYGMTDFINPASCAGDTVTAIRDLTGGGVDAAFECTGHLKVMRQAIDVCLPAWGKAVLMGVEPPGGELAFPPVQVRYGKTISGSYFGGIKGRSGLGALIDRYMSGEIDLVGQISHRLPLQLINEGFDLMRAGASVRTVISLV